MKSSGESYDIPQDNDPKVKWIGWVIFIEFLTAMGIVIWIIA